MVGCHASWNIAASTLPDWSETSDIALFSSIPILLGCPNPYRIAPTSGNSGAVVELQYAPDLDRSSFLVHQLWLQTWMDFSANSFAIIRIVAHCD